MASHRRSLLALAVAPFAGSAGPAAARRREQRDPDVRATGLARIWVLRSQGTGHAPRSPQTWLDGRDIGSLDATVPSVHEVPAGVHLVWTSEATAGHLSLLLRANEEVVLLLESTPAPSPGLRLVRMTPDEGRAAIAAALQARRHDCASGGS